MINTLKYAKILEEVGFSREQAETSVRILVEIMEEKLATKQDLRDTAQETKHEIQGLRRETKHEIQELRRETKREIQELRRETKREIQELRQETKREIQELRQDVQDLKVHVGHSLAQLRSELTIRTGAMMGAAVALVTALNKLL